MVYKRLDGLNLAIDTNRISILKRDELASRLSDLKVKNSLFNDYPLEEGESLEDWQTRIAPELVAKDARKDGEGSDAYVKRVILDKDSSKFTKGLVFDTLQLLGELFDNKDKVTQDAFNNTSYVASKAYIKDILDPLDIDTKSFE
jgi:hypothetical protein